MSSIRQEVEGAVDDAVDGGERPQAQGGDDVLGYAIYNPNAGGFRNAGFFGQSLFETEAQAKREAGPEDIAVEVIPLDGEEVTYRRVESPSESTEQPKEEPEPEPTPDEGVDGAVETAINLSAVDDKAEQQARGFAAAMYSHVHGSGEMGRQRINVLVAQVADRLYDGPGEITTNHDASQAILVVDGDDIRHWDFWVGIETAAEEAPEDRDEFIEQVSKAVIGSIEEVLRESENAT